MVAIPDEDYRAEKHPHIRASRHRNAFNLTCPSLVARGGHTSVWGHNPTPAANVQPLPPVYYTEEAIPLKSG